MGAGEVTTPVGKQEAVLKVVDSRKSPDAGQTEKLRGQIEKDDILGSLEEAKAFLGKYSTRSPQELVVNIVDGKLGEATVRGTQIEIQMPHQVDAVSHLKSALKPTFGEISEQVADELVFALATSTILHEGVHAILDSTPSSQLAADYERVSGTPNTDGKVVTPLDEGIAYAIQGRFAGEVEPIGSLAPRINEQDSPEIKKRKALGEKLKPKIIEYMEAGQAIDDRFLAFAAQAIKEIENQ